MRTTNLLLLLCSILFLCSTAGNTQSRDRDVEEEEEKTYRLFTKRGYYLSLGSLPVKLHENSGRIAQYNHGDLYGFSYGLKYNLLDLNDNLSISADGNLSLGILGSSRVSNGFDLNLFSLRVPVSLSFNFGAGSTFDTDNNLGLGLSGGMEYWLTPLVIFSDNDFRPYDRQSFISPFVQLSFRYWRTSKNMLKEVYLRYNLLSNDEELVAQSPNAFDDPFVITLGFTSFLNY